MTNTGTVPIDQVDFTIKIWRWIFFIPVERVRSQSITGIDIQPGETRRVEFSQGIPYTYNGYSTEGEYDFLVKASLSGTEIGSYTKTLTVV